MWRSVASIGDGVLRFLRPSGACTLSINYDVVLLFSKSKMSLSTVLWQLGNKNSGVEIGQKTSASVH